MTERLDRRSFIRSATMGGGAVVLSGGRAALASVATADGGLSLRAFGAVGNGVADDGPALQRAVDALVAARGGTLSVPPGVYRIVTPVSGDFTNATSVVIEGAGSSSQLLIATGAGKVAFTLTNLESGLVEDLILVGTPGQRTDTDVALAFATCKQATLRRCDAYGVSGRAVVQATYTDLRIENSSFRGCGGSTPDSGVVRVDDWLGLSVTDTDFIDYGNLNGVFHSKTPIALPQAWVRVGNASGDNSETKVELNRVRMDEGAAFGFACIPDASVSPRVSSVVLSGVRANVAQFGGGRGCHISNVRNVRIEHSWFGYTQNQRDAIFVHNSVNVLIDACRCVAGSNRIVLDSAVVFAHIRECEYTVLVSDAQRTHVTTQGITAALAKADGVIESNTLVAFSSTTAGRVVTAPAGAESSSIAGVALDATAAAGDRTRVVRLQGAVIPVRSDGFATIPLGASLAPSPTMAGRVRAITSGAQAGRAASSAPVSPNALADMELLPGTRPPDPPTPAILQSGWLNFGGSRAGAAYYKDPDGRVWLQGSLKDGAVAPGTPIFTLPVGYRPANDTVLTAPTSTGIAQVTVSKAGVVAPLRDVMTDFLGFDGLSFRIT